MSQGIVQLFGADEAKGREVARSKTSVQLRVPLKDRQQAIKDSYIVQHELQVWRDMAVGQPQLDDTAVLDMFWSCINRANTIINRVRRNR